MDIVVKQQIPIEKLWEAVWGCDGAGMTYWSNKVRKTNGHDIDFWNKNSNGDYIAKPQDFKVHNYIEGKWHKVTLEDLAKGYVLAKLAGQNHCGSMDLDMEDPDGCFGDMVIQYAIFGELVYG